MNNICPICEVGTLEDRTDDNEGLLLEYSYCNECGSEIANWEQLKRNAERGKERREEYMRQYTLERGEPEIVISDEAIEELTNILSNTANPLITKWMSDEIDRAVIESFKAYAIRKKLYSKPTRKNKRWKKKNRNG